MKILLSVLITLCSLIAYSQEDTVRVKQNNLITTNEFEELVQVHRALGSQMVAQKPIFNDLEVNTTAITMVDNRIYLLPIVVKRDTIITGVKFTNQTQGNYTADNNNKVGLYSYSGGTLTLVASSTNDGNLWKGAANTLQTKAFTTPYLAVAGVYYVAMLYNQSAVTTAPALFGTNSFGTAAARTLDHTNSAKLLGNITGNDLPATQAMSGVTSASDWAWYMIY